MAKALDSSNGDTDLDEGFASQAEAGIVNTIVEIAHLADTLLGNSAPVDLERRDVPVYCLAESRTLSSLSTLSHGLEPLLQARPGVRDGDTRIRTKEQRLILKFGADVNKFADKYPVLVITAGAGTGKTSVLRWLVEELSGAYGKDEIAFFVFNKAAAADAERTFKQWCNVSTLAASSMATLARQRNCRSVIFAQDGANSFQALLRKIAKSMFE